MMTSKNIFQSVLMLALVAMNVSCSSQKDILNPKKISNVDLLLSAMTIEEKVGQMTQLNIDVV